MNLDALRVLVATVDAGSMAAAAGQLGMSRATVARRLDELEAEAGVPLVVRTKAGLYLTSTGEELVAHGRAIVGLGAALLASARRVGSAAEGTVRIVGQHGLPAEGATQVFRILRAGWPDVRVIYEESPRPMDRLLGQSDIAVTLDLALPDGPWESYDVMPAPERLVATPAYLASHPPIERVEQLRDHPIALWRPADVSQNDPPSLPLQNGGTFPIEPAVESGDFEVIRRIASSGQAIGLVPDGAFSAARLGDEEVTRVLPDLVGRDRLLRLVLVTGTLRTPRLAAIADTVRRMAAGLRQPH